MCFCNLRLKQVYFKIYTYIFVYWRWLRLKQKEENTKKLLLLQAMKQDSGSDPSMILVDGGMTASEVEPECRKFSRSRRRPLMFIYLFLYSL
jgi:hypothetical protein